MMKYLKYVVIFSMSFIGLNNGTAVFAEEVLSLARDENDVYIEAIFSEQGYSLEQLHETFGDPENQEEIDDITMRQTFYLEDEDEVIALEVIADILTDTDEVNNLTFNIDFLDISYEDSQGFEEAYSNLVEEALEQYNNEVILQKDDIIDFLGEPTTITLAGAYELLVYSIENKESARDYIVVLFDDYVYALNQHSGADPELERDFNLTQSQLNQMAHTSGVTLQDMIQEIGQPDSVFHDFPNSVITYVWYSDTDEDFSEISYITDFRGVMVGIGHQLQEE